MQFLELLFRIGFALLRAVATAFIPHARAAGRFFFPACVHCTVASLRFSCWVCNTVRTWALRQAVNKREDEQVQPLWSCPLVRRPYTGYIPPWDLQPRWEACLGVKHAGLTLQAAYQFCARLPEKRRSCVHLGLFHLALLSSAVSALASKIGALSPELTTEIGKAMTAVLTLTPATTMAAARIMA